MDVNINRDWIDVNYLNAQIEALQRENKRLNALLESKRIEDIEVNLN